MSKQPENVRAFFERLGRPRIWAETGIRQQELWRAAKKNEIPSSWYDAIEKLCIDDGIDCPRRFFNFKPIRPIKREAEKCVSDA